MVVPTFGTGLKKENYCINAKSIRNFKAQAYEYNSHLAGANSGGLLNQGTCWWHSRLQQASLYLTYFSPNKPKPTNAEARRLVSLLTTLRAVIEIPGFSNFHDFSRAYWPEIQSKLNQWQLFEGIFKFSWIDGLIGSPKLPSHQLRKEIEKSYYDVETLGRVTFNKLQLPGIPAHSLLLVNIKPILNGFQLIYIDSNYPTEMLSTYFKDGMNSILNGVPYLERRKDFNKISESIKSYCINRSSNVYEMTEEQLDLLIKRDLEEYITNPE